MTSVQGKPDYYSYETNQSDSTTSSPQNLKGQNKDFKVSQQKTASSEREEAAAKKAFSSQPKKAPSRPAPKAPHEEMETAKTPPISRKTMDNAETPPLKRKAPSFPAPKPPTSDINTAKTPPLAKRFSPFERFEQKCRKEGRWCEDTEDATRILSHNHYLVMRDDTDAHYYYVAVLNNSEISYLQYAKLDFIRLASSLSEEEVVKRIKENLPYKIPPNDLDTIKKGSTPYERLKNAYSISEIRNRVENDTLEPEDKQTLLDKIIGSGDVKKLLRDIHPDKDPNRDPGLSSFFNNLKNK